mmetsp:Transcript_21947/g.29892  ORF Transcript_21947/g.29892 Transcript_21947/m.29892 type:complete len:241 (+) Transcript_21947:314-1036(+)
MDKKHTVEFSIGSLLARSGLLTILGSRFFTGPLVTSTTADISPPPSTFGLSCLRVEPTEIIEALCVVPIGPFILRASEAVLLIQCLPLLRGSQATLFTPAQGSLKVCIFVSQRAGARVLSPLFVIASPLLHRCQIVPLNRRLFLDLVTFHRLLELALCLPVLALIKRFDLLVLKNELLLHLRHVGVGLDHFTEKVIWSFPRDIMRFENCPPALDRLEGAVIERLLPRQVVMGITQRQRFG